MQLLPLSRASYFAANIQLFNNSEQLTIIRWLLKGQLLEEINQNFSEFKSSLQNASGHELERSEIIRELLLLTAKNPIEPLLGGLLEICVENSIIDCLNEFCEAITDELLLKINAELMIRLLTYRDNPNEALLTAVTERIRNADSDYTFEFIGKIVARKEILLLEKLKEPLLVFLLSPVRSSEQKYDESANILRELVLLYLTKPLTRSAAKKFFSMLVSILPSNPNHQTIDMVYLLIDLIKSHNRKFKDKRTYNATLKRIRKWIQESEVDQQEDSRKEIDTTYSANSINIPDKESEKNVLNSQRGSNSEDIQVPATQGIKDLPSSLQLSSQNDIKSSHTIKLKNFPITNLAQPEILAEISRSSTNEFLGEADGESTGEGDQQANTTQLDDKTINDKSIYSTNNGEMQVTELQEYSGVHPSKANSDQQTEVVIDKLEGVKKELVKTSLDQNLVDNDDLVQCFPGESPVLEDKRPKDHEKDKKMGDVSSFEEEGVSSSTELVPTIVKSVSQQLSTIPKGSEKADLNCSGNLSTITLSSNDQAMTNKNGKEQRERTDNLEKQDSINNINKESFMQDKITQNEPVKETALQIREDEGKYRTCIVERALPIINAELSDGLQNSSGIMLVNGLKQKEGSKVDTLNHGEDEKVTFAEEDPQMISVNSSKENAQSIDSVPMQNAVKGSVEAITTEETLTVHLRDSETTEFNKMMERQQRKGQKINTNDDFAPVDENDRNEGFLEAMEQVASRETSLLKEQTEVADTSVLPEIRIPIFNSLKIQESNGQIKQKLKMRLQRNESMPPDSPPRVASNANTNNVLNDSTSVGKEGKYDEIQLAQSHIEKDGDPLLVGEGNEDATSREATPSLKIHFSSKKSRKLVSRLRGFTPGDLNGISVEERRNLRIELLDFMMRLEYYSNRDDDMV